MTKNKPQNHNENITTTTTTTTTSESDLRREMNNVTRHTSDFFNEGQPPRNEPPTSDLNIGPRPLGPGSEETITSIPNTTVPGSQSFINNIPMPRLRGPRQHQLLNTVQAPTPAPVPAPAPAAAPVVPAPAQIEPPELDPYYPYNYEQVREALLIFMEEQRRREENRIANIDIYNTIRDNLRNLRSDTTNLIQSIMTFAWNHPILTTGFSLITIGGITWFFYRHGRYLFFATPTLVGSNFIENLFTPPDHTPRADGVARPPVRFTSLLLLGAQAGGSLFLLKVLIIGLRH